MTPTEEHKFNMRLIAFATILLVVFACNKIWTPIEEPEVEQLRLVTHAIQVDMANDLVYASDFVADIHLGDSEETYTGDVEFELYNEDGWWNTEWDFDCEDLGEHHFWVRALYAAPYHESSPVKTSITISDAGGICGWPQNPEAPPEHGEQDES